MNGVECMGKKEKMLVVLGMGMLIGLSGCTKNADTVNTEKTSKRPVITADAYDKEELEDKVLSPYYTFADENDKNLAAMFNIGIGNQEKKEKLPDFLSRYNLKEDIFEIVADQDNCEWYAVFPKYIGTKITVEHVELDDEGNLLPTETLTETEKPVLLCCNQSDIIPSVQVTVSNADERIVFNPFISLESGKLSKVDRVYTEE